MKIRIEGITEDEVVSASATLDENGFVYDVDYTTLYGAQWAIVGLEFKSSKAAALVIAHYARIEEATVKALHEQAKRERAEWWRTEEADDDRPLIEEGNDDEL